MPPCKRMENAGFGGRVWGYQREIGSLLSVET